MNLGRKNVIYHILHGSKFYVTQASPDPLVNAARAAGGIISADSHASQLYIILFGTFLKPSSTPVISALTMQLWIHSFR